MQTFTARELSRRPEHAKRAADDEPVFITQRGKHSHVLLSNAEYERLTRQPRLIVEALAMPGVGSTDLKSVLPSRQDLPRAAESG